MKNYIYSFFIIFYGIHVSAQVGVNTKNPQQKFHIDGKNNAATTNPTTGSPSSAQQTDDFVVTQAGNIGTGLIAPSTRLDINNGTNNGAIKIVDGTQGLGKVLVSDSNGIGQWVLPNSLKSVIVGTFGKTATGAGLVVSSDTSSWKYSNVSIKLTKGIWMVNMGLTLKSFLEYTKGQWVHFRLSSTNSGIAYTGWQNLGTANNNTSYAGVVFGSAVYNGNTFQHFEANSNNYLSGSNIIEVLDTEVTLYLMIESFNNDTTYPAGFTAPNAGVVWQFDTSNWENYFYANPL